MTTSDAAPYSFKTAMFIGELQMPLEQALPTAKDIGVEYVWFIALPGRPPVAEMSDAELDEIADKVADNGLKLMMISAASPFKFIHLTDLEADSLAEHPDFRRDFDNLVRSMEIAARLGVGVVSAYSFAWPGEYTADKPTWPMRWLTRGGHIADVDMEKLVSAFTLVVEQAESHGVDVSVSMMPWNYTNTTGNFRRLAECVKSPRLRVMWGPADNYNCGEADVAQAGFNNVRPYVHSLHIKDLRVNDGLRRDFDYQPLGDGDVDYLTVLRNLRDHRSDAFLSLATHFRPPSGSAEEAMRINHARLTELTSQVESE